MIGAANSVAAVSFSSPRLGYGDGEVTGLSTTGA
jgi:hypothetical protein